MFFSSCSRCMSMWNYGFSGSGFCCHVALLCYTAHMEGTAIPSAQLATLDILCIPPVVGVCDATCSGNTSQKAAHSHRQCTGAWQLHWATLHTLRIQLVVGVCCATCSWNTSHKAVQSHRQCTGAWQLQGAMLHKQGRACVGLLLFLGSFKLH